MLSDKVLYNQEQTTQIDYSRQPYLDLRSFTRLDDVLDCVQVNEDGNLFMRGKDDYWTFQVHNEAHTQELAYLVEFLSGWLEMAKQRQTKG